MTPQGSHRLIRAIIACCLLGDRRDDVEADVIELFEARLLMRGRIYAVLRLLGDAISLAMPSRYASVRGAWSRRTPLHARVWGPRALHAARVTGWAADLRYGLRLLARHPAVIGATIVGLALAIAVSTTVFTILNASVLRPFGMDDPGAVVRVQMLVTGGMANEWPYHAFAGMRERASHARIEASTREGVRFSLSPTNTPGRADSLLLVSGGYLPMLGGRAVVGRALQPSDDEPGAAPVVALNHRIWTTRLNSDPDIVGTTVWLSGTPVTVVGVIEPAFTGPVDNPPAFWAPFGSYAAIYRDRPIERTSAMHVSVIARVNAGVDRTAATGELSAIAAALPGVGIRNEAGGTEPVTGVQLDGASSPMDGPDSAAMPLVVGVILVVVGLVLALACVNVANLLLAGAAARSREIGVRLALGASRRRILRQLLTESVLIGLMAGAAGLLLSLWLVPIVAAATGLPETYDVRPDALVLLFTASIAVLSGLGAGLAPARHGARGDLAGVLKSEGSQTGAPPKATRLRRWFIGFQAAGSILLLVTAALFLRAALHVTRVDLGFDADKLATVAAAFPRGDSGAAAAGAYWQAVLERVRAIPSVEGASLALHPPFGGAVAIRHVTRGGDTYRIHENRTDARYFDTAGFRLLRGRGYTADEARADAPVAVVSESIVRDFLGGAEPIGASLSAVAESLSQVTIVGVVAEAVTARVRGRGNGTIYRPLPPAEMETAQLVVRAPDPSAIVRNLETVLLAVNPRVRPVTNIIRDDVDQYRNEPKVLAGLSSAVAGLALVLSVLGVFGVTTFVVSQRMWEMQVRRALGASAGTIVRLLVRQSLTPVAIGLGAGLVAVLAAARVLTPALSGVSPYDPFAIVGALAILVVAAFAAVLAPARRAARTNPASVLRSS